jgi:hypothetical protein
MIWMDGDTFILRIFIAKSRRFQWIFSAECYDLAVSQGDYLKAFGRMTLGNWFSAQDQSPLDTADQLP